MRWGAAAFAFVLLALLALLPLLGSQAWSADRDLPGADWVAIPGGRLVTGDPEGAADEIERTVDIAPFRLMRHEVTVRQFAAFVAATGHRTAPERRDFGYVWTRRWHRRPGATWRRPGGPGQAPAAGDHPVVQVSAADAERFCAWYGLRLPTEEEWEFAARGTDRRRYPWGDTAPEQVGVRHANFGTVTCCAPDDSDGFATTAPVGSYPSGASPFGVLDMAGNVWEWTASRFPGKPAEVVLRGGGWGNNPYCLRTSYRHGNPPDIGLDMVGFRCAAGADR